MAFFKGGVMGAGSGDLMGEGSEGKFLLSYFSEFKLTSFLYCSLDS